MKTITWDEIKNSTISVEIEYSKDLLDLLDSNGYRCNYIAPGKHNSIGVYNKIKHYQIFKTPTRVTIFRFIGTEPSVPCSNGSNDSNGSNGSNDSNGSNGSNNLSGSIHPNQCCSNPNIVENIVLDKPFKVCRNCKQEVQ